MNYHYNSKGSLKGHSTRNSDGSTTHHLSRLSIYSDKPSEMPYFKRY